MSVGSLQAEIRVVLPRVTWSTFESLLAETDHRNARFTYDRFTNSNLTASMFNRPAVRRFRFCHWTKSRAFWLVATKPMRPRGFARFGRG